MSVYSNFNDLAAAFGIKERKPKAEKLRKCPNCGGAMRKCDGTNVYICEFHKLENKTFADGTEVQVFSKCDTTIIA